MEVYTICTTIVATIAGVVTIVWFIRDMRKENSKVLKRQEDILVKIEEGQRKGFEMLSKDLKLIQKSLEIQTKILDKIQSKIK